MPKKSELHVDSEGRLFVFNAGGERLLRRTRLAVKRSGCEFTDIATCHGYVMGSALQTETMKL